MNQFVQTPVSIPVAALNIGDSYAGLTLRFGVLAPVTTQTGETVGEAVQWTHQAMLSPTSAVQLRDMLDAAIKGWEGRFGAIPVMGISFTKNGEAPQPEPRRVACQVCGGGGRSCSKDDPLDWINCEACDGLGTVPAESAAVSILEQFRKPPTV